MEEGKRAKKRFCTPKLNFFYFLNVQVRRDRLQIQHNRYQHTPYDISHDRRKRDPAALALPGSLGGNNNPAHMARLCRARAIRAHALR